MLLMAQCSVYENTNQETRETMPYLVDVQNDFLQVLQTRVVIPLCPSPPLLEKPIDSLTLGGELDIVARFPDGKVNIDNFSDLKDNAPA
jgi:hypothetical protein